MIRSKGETGMRPPSIVNFTQVVLLSLAIQIVSALLSWDKVERPAAAAGRAGIAPGTMIGILVVLIGLYLLLIWFISAHGSPAAKWIYVVLCSAGLGLGLIRFEKTMSDGTGPAILAAVQYILSIVSLWLLFRPDSKPWFSEGRGDPGSPLR
jgi:lysylphosphatidylglycerol synthetase-like protein (DUF2156 family)